MRLPPVVLLTTIRAASAASAQLTIGTGESLSLSHASLNLGCSDLVVTGTKNTDGQKRKVVGRQGLEPWTLGLKARSRDRRMRLE